MIRRSRVFKLRLSAAGMDLLIGAHCHLIQSTRALLAWGTTLHVAVVHLATLPTDKVLAGLRLEVLEGCLGREEYYLGAPKGLSELASGIAEKLRATSGGAVDLNISDVYIIALQQIVLTEPDCLRIAHRSVRKDG